MTIKNQAFTLVELLVVVLIIGILAAVAIPQYQKTVEKAKFTKIFPLMKALEQAQELYAMENGAYATSLAKFPISYSVPDEFTVYANYSNIGVIRAVYCPGKAPTECNISQAAAIADIVLSNPDFINHSYYKTKAGDRDCLSKRYGKPHLCKAYCNAFGPCTIND